MGDSLDDRQRDDRVGDENLPPRLAEDRFYRALAASQRRRLLYYLLAEEESYVDELATVLGGWNATATGTMHTSADRSELRLTLVHNHLPLLTEAGLIDYNPQDGTVQIAPLHPRVADIIRWSITAEQRLEP
ncbi:DUF7344 domain-containing protein [Halobellus marinus]|uniref:DUF7344 domain-containing protein n=1 Tax=Halobellus TaxID=1073986 RepID=UPI0028A99F1F|nr:ArsR family transcriptional regulator [Halobellus sp. DFY28]